MLVGKERWAEITATNNPRAIWSKVELDLIMKLNRQMYGTLMRMWLRTVLRRNRKSNLGNRLGLIDHLMKKLRSILHFRSSKLWAFKINRQSRVFCTIKKIRGSMVILFRLIDKTVRQLEPDTTAKMIVKHIKLDNRVTFKKTKVSTWLLEKLKSENKM